MGWAGGITPVNTLGVFYRSIISNIDPRSDYALLGARGGVGGPLIIRQIGAREHIGLDFIEQSVAKVGGGPPPRGAATGPRRDPPYRR